MSNKRQETIADIYARRNEMKKYELTEETKTLADGTVMHRIRALMDIPRYCVKDGDLGGFVEQEKNLSQDGDAWVTYNAWVFGDAEVFGNAEVCGDAMVSDNAQVFGEARVYGEAWVCGNAQVFGEARVYGEAWVCGNAEVSGDAEVCGDARVCGEVKE